MWGWAGRLWWLTSLGLQVLGLKFLDVSPGLWSAAQGGLSLCRGGTRCEGWGSCVIQQH